MGNCTSTSDRQAKAHSDAIDKEIENDSKKFRKECKILLLGALGISILGFHVQFALLASNALLWAYYMGGCVSPTMLRSTRVTVQAKMHWRLFASAFSTVVLNDASRTPLGGHAGG
jgi:hypothetical protein